MQEIFTFIGVGSFVLLPSSECVSGMTFALFDTLVFEFTIGEVLASTRSAVGPAVSGGKLILVLLGPLLKGRL